MSEQAEQNVPEITPQHIGAAVSKLVSASIGDIAVVFSKSPAHKFHTFADLEWMILPAVITGQFYVAEVQQAETGARAPVAAILWASVSDEVDARLSASAGQRIRLRPEEWKSGDILWLVDVAGEPQAAAAALRHLNQTVFKERAVKAPSRTGDGATSIVLLGDMFAAPEPATETTP